MVDEVGFFLGGLAEGQTQSAKNALAKRGLELDERKLGLSEQRFGLEQLTAEREQKAKVRKGIEERVNSVTADLVKAIQAGETMFRTDGGEETVQALQTTRGAAKQFLEQLLQVEMANAQAAGVDPSDILRRAVFQLKNADSKAAVTLRQTAELAGGLRAGGFDEETAAATALAASGAPLQETPGQTRRENEQVAIRAENRGVANQKNVAEFQAQLAERGATLTGRQVQLGDGTTSPITRIGKNDFYRDQTGKLRSVKELPGGAQIFTRQEGKLPASEIDKLNAGISSLQSTISQAEAFQQEVEDIDLGTAGGVKEFAGRASRTLADLVKGFMPESVAAATEDALTAIFGENGEVDLDEKKLKTLEFRLEEALIESMRLARGRAPLAETQKRIRERVRLRGGVASAADVRAQLNDVVLQLKDNLRQMQTRAQGRIQEIQQESQPSDAPVKFTLEELEAISKGDQPLPETLQ